MPRKSPRFLPTVAERNAAAFVARPKELYRRAAQPNIEPSRSELQMDLRVAHTMLRELLALIAETRAKAERERGQSVDARTLLAELLTMAHQQDGRRRLVVEEGSELWQRIAKLALVPREQLEIEFLPPKAAARLVDPPRSERRQWWAG